MSRPLAALLILSAGIVPAASHVTLERGVTAPGAYKAVLRVPHGCGHDPTTGDRKSARLNS